MNFSDIKSNLTEVTESIHASNFDIDKPVDINERQDVKYDDHEKPYRIGDNLIPDNTFEKNEYRYTTDYLGRIVSGEGTLQVKDHSGRLTIKDNMDTIGKGDQKETDDRGHIIADQFNGSNSMENLVPQDAALNQIEVKALENSLEKEVKNGKEVYLKVEPHYINDSHRPDSFTYTYKIDGEKSIKIFRNGE